MDTAVIVVIVIVALVVVGIAVWAAMRARQRAQLRDRFGPEYERVVDTADGRQERREAETELAERASRRDELDIRDLAPPAQERFAARWEQIQANFVDQPGGAVRDADALVAEVMGARGYPVEDFESQADLVSVDHPDLVENYRAGHRIAVRHSRNEATTEDLRRAFLHYRKLFEELLGGQATTRDRTAR